MPIRKHLRAASVAGVLAAAGFVAVAASQDMQPFGGQQDVAYAATLWNALIDANLAGDNAVNSVPYAGVEPHGLVLETLYRDLEVDGHTGLVIVKRNYGPAGVSIDDVKADRAEHFDAVTVMFQREAGYDPDNRDWFWAKYGADGSLDANPAGMQLAGRVAKGADEGCIACHSGAEGDDLVFTFDLAQ